MTARIGRRDLMSCAGFGASSFAQGSAVVRDALAFNAGAETVMASSANPCESPKLSYAYDALAPAYSPSGI